MAIVQSLCWMCGNACGKGCSWSESFIPVEGWEAIRDDKNDSYTVVNCPKFRSGNGRPEEWDIEGCQELAAAIIKTAIVDYKAGVKRGLITRFFRSKAFANISKIDPEWLIQALKESVEENND